MLNNMFSLLEEISSIFISLSFLTLLAAGSIVSTEVHGIRSGRYRNIRTRYLRGEIGNLYNLQLAKEPKVKDINKQVFKVAFVCWIQSEPKYIVDLHAYIFQVCFFLNNRLLFFSHVL